MDRSTHCHKIRWFAFFLFASLAIMFTNVGTNKSLAAEPHETIVFIGTYTKGEEPGIFSFRMNSQTGELTAIGSTGGVASPSFLAIHPNGKYLYAVSEVSEFNGKPTGAVAAFAINPRTFELGPLNKQPSMGDGPCHLIVDHSGKCLLVANYGGGSIAALPINKDGTLQAPTSSIQHKGKSVVTDRQEGPHAHAIVVDANNKFALAADLGLDKVLVYRFDAEHGELQPNDPPSASLKPGAGPRHIGLHSSGRFAFINNEIDSTVTAFSYHADRGTLESLQTLSTLPDDFKGENSTAEIQIHPSGKFVYVSNRGHDSLAIFSIDTQTGKLKALGHQSTGGKTPRGFNISSDGKFILAANQDSDNVVVFKVDSETGKLQPTGAEVKVPKPVCVEFLPTSN